MDVTDDGNGVLKGIAPKFAAIEAKLAEIETKAAKAQRDVEAEKTWRDGLGKAMQNVTDLLKGLFEKAEATAESTRLIGNEMTRLRKDLNKSRQPVRVRQPRTIKRRK